MNCAPKLWPENISDDFSKRRGRAQNLKKGGRMCSLPISSSVSISTHLISKNAMKSTILSIKHRDIWTYP